MKRIGIKTAFYFALLFTSKFCLSQNAIQGHAIAPRGEPLEGASVLLFMLHDSSYSKGLVTDKAGDFEFRNVQPGEYYVACSYTGYLDTYSPNFHVTNNSRILLSPLRFQQNNTDMSAVTVSAKKPLLEQKIDRTVINVATSLTNAGSTVLEILMRSPGISVNHQNNTISMNGKDGVFIMLNGKLSRMSMSAMVQLLAGMNSSNVERIELITSPPANFDAEGNAGFINIVLKKNENYGTNGSLSVTAGYLPIGGLTNAASINLNHRSGRWNLYGDYTFNRVEPHTGLNLERNVINGNNIIKNVMNSDRDDFRRNHIGRIGVDVDLSKRTVIGALFSGLSNMYGMDALNESNIYMNNRLDTVMLIDQFERHPLDNYSANFNILHQYKEGRRVSFNADYVHYRDANRLTYQYNFFDEEKMYLYSNKMKSRKETPINFYVATLDFVSKVKNNIELESGVKATLSDFVNDVIVENEEQGAWTVDKNFSSIHNLDENILAAYSSLNVNIDKKTKSKLGLRYEFTSSNLGSETTKNIVARKYGNWFPSVFISRIINENNSYNLSYTRRITRPTFNDMAPFVYFFDPNTFFSGNPALQPAISNSFKTDYIFKRLIFSFSYTYEKNTITNFVPEVDVNTNKQTFAAANQKNKNIYSVILSLPVNVSGIWTMQNNVTGEWQKLNAVYNGSPLAITQGNLQINSTQSFTLPKNYSIELNGNFQSGGVFGLYKLDPMLSLNFGIQKKISPKSGTISFNVTDFSGGPHLVLSAYAPKENIDTKVDIRFVATTFKLTYSRSFGNNTLKENRKRNTGSEEEKQRVKVN